MVLNDTNDFLKTFHILTNENSKWQVWQDFIFMSSCSISNAIAKNDYKNREAEYLRTIGKYKERDRQLFPKLFAKLVMALENNPEQDFLGKIFMELGLNYHHNGQFFTPYNVCQLMSEITLSGLEENIEKNGYFSIDDPACGAGATLIASANICKKILSKQGKNFQNHVIFTGQDIDKTVGLMCYLQLSLLGCAGFVKIGNTLTDPIRDGDNIAQYWFTPMYFSDIWRTRRILSEINILMKGENK